MEIGIEREKNVFKALWPAVIVVAMAFALVVIAYGMESIAPGRTTRSIILGMLSACRAIKYPVAEQQVSKNGDGLR